MIDLKNVVADFQKASAYALLDDLVRVCGVDSVLGALSEITAAQQTLAPDAAALCPECGEPFYFCAMGHYDVAKARRG